jgi:hypothetical protein
LRGCYPAIPHLVRPGHRVKTRRSSGPFVRGSPKSRNVKEEKEPELS